jgi:hypothetical protein
MCKTSATSIRRNIKLAESCSFGQTVFEYAPRSHGAVDYARLADDVLAEPMAAERASTVSVAVADPLTSSTQAGEFVTMDPSRNGAVAATS